MTAPLLSFSMSGAPRGQGRPRATARRGLASVYKAATDRRYESSVAAVARTAMGALSPLEGALSVSLRFRLPVPKSATKRDRAAYLSGEQAYFGAFDIDNLAKAILDGCNGICWVDDRQIVRLFVTKIAAEMPGVDVVVRAWAPGSAEEAA